MVIKRQCGPGIQLMPCNGSRQLIGSNATECCEDLQRTPALGCDYYTTQLRRACGEALGAAVAVRPTWLLVDQTGCRVHQVSMQFNWFVKPGDPSHFQLTDAPAWSPCLPPFLPPAQVQVNELKHQLDTAKRQRWRWRLGWGPMQPTTSGEAAGEAATPASPFAVAAEECGQSAQHWRSWQQECAGRVSLRS
jgi:hypothetical protein